MQKLFSNKITSVLIALVVCALWGSLFPFVKMGYAAFFIKSSDIPTIILFAGTRFTISGIILLLCCAVREKSDAIPKKSALLPLFLISLTSTILHYLFTYMALSIGEGSKSAIIKQVGFLFLSCFAFLFVKDDKFSAAKLCSGILGFLGIIVTSFDGGSFSFATGDALLILASFCSVASMIISKKAVTVINPLQLVAYPQLFGGIVLSVTGALLGGKITHIDANAVAIFAYICFASIAAYSLWSTLIKYNDISKLSVIKFTEPLFAVIFSGALLGENIFKLNYLLAFIIIIAAILLNNYRRNMEK